jgi:hypothetical protein
MAVTRYLALAGLLIIGTAVVALGQARTSHACTRNPYYNPLVEADAVVAGYVLGFDVARDAPIVPGIYPVDFGLRVERVLAGEVDEFATVRSGDPAWNDEFDGFGPALCGTLRSVDVGRFVLISLVRTEDGLLHAEVPFYSGDGPNDPRFEEVLNNFQHPFLPDDAVPGPPSVGTGRTSRGDGVPLVLVGATLIAAGTLGLAMSRR